MRKLAYLFGTLVAIGLLALGCDSVTEPTTDNSTPAPAATGVTSPSVEGDVVTITEADLGPSERPGGSDVPEEDWFTPTHGDEEPLNTELAFSLSGFVSAPDHEDTFGEGSFLFDVPNNNPDDAEELEGERVWILTDKYGTGEWHGPSNAKEGTDFSEITELKYWTFISEELPGGDEQDADLVPSLQIMAYEDPEGPSDYLGLVFDPDADKATTGQWQEWDALDESHAGWRHADDQGPDAYMKWSEVKTKYQNAVIGWQIGIAAGTWPGKAFHGYADRLTVGVDGEGTTTYNFQPLTKGICKDGGWEDHGFKNQGQCIRYVNTEQDSR